MLPYSQVTVTTGGSPGARRFVLAAMLLGSVCLSVPSAVLGQNPPTVTTTDAYGNAQAGALQRRNIGSYANETQFQALRGFQERNRRSFQRGGLTPFSLRANYELNTGGGLWQDVRRALSLRGNPIWGEAGGRTGRLEAFRRFGGFGARVGENQAGDLLSILGRSSSLTQANALNAPIDRAMWRLGTAGGFASLQSERPMIIEDVPDLPEDAPTLGEHIRRQTQLNLERSLELGWEAFTDGEFRRSLRYFQAAAIQGRDEAEPAVGEVLSYLLSGSISAATVNLRQLAGRLDNPFMVELPPRLRGRLADDQVLVRSLLITRRFSETNADTPEAVGLHVFFLWFSGQQDEAIRVAQTLPGIAPLSPFASWPEKLETALQTIWVPGS